MKRIISAAIVKIIEFDSMDEAKKYLDEMKAAEKNFRVMWECDLAGGKRQIKIQEQYNKSPMLRE